jgi:uncharacterized protein (TIGR03032 family)
LSRKPTRRAASIWATHDRDWRDPWQIVSHWQEAKRTSPELLRSHATPGWWEALGRSGITLVVSREYEHLLVAMTASAGGQRPLTSYFPMPHPSGIVFDRRRSVLHVASTRNPNQVYDLVPANLEKPAPLVPVRSRFFPGRLYMHDLALIGGRLYANAVGQNAVVRLHDDGRYMAEWWPRCIETDVGPAFGKNYIQLNSIGAGPSLARSYFSASADRLSSRRPSHKNFPVDGRGVIFSGRTRDVIARGLTRPHSVRLRDGQIWVDNSGYGEFGRVDDGQLTVIARLPGWTRGLCFVGDLAFIGTSRVIPRFRQYAPGLDVSRSVCGVHALDMRSGAVLGSITWSHGNQIFAIEAVPSTVTSGFPFIHGRRPADREKDLFYSFTATQVHGHD